MVLRTAFNETLAPFPLGSQEEKNHIDTYEKVEGGLLNFTEGLHIQKISSRFTSLSPKSMHPPWAGMVHWAWRLIQREDFGVQPPAFQSTLGHLTAVRSWARFYTPFPHLGNGENTVSFNEYKHKSDRNASAIALHLTSRTLGENSQGNL